MISLLSDIKYTFESVSEQQMCRDVQHYCQVTWFLLDWLRSWVKDFCINDMTDTLS